MPVLWRLYRARYGPGLDGIGGTFAGGRWHRKGEYVVYFGATAAITVLERLAHTNPDLLPDDLLLGRFEFDRAVVEARIEEYGELPAGWSREEELTRQLGEKWRSSGTSSIIAVPSAVLPEESNFILNPRHPESHHLKLIRERSFAFDPRLL